MSRKSLDGRYGSGQRDGRKRRRPTSAPPTPLEFALSVMRDETQTPALRASMAKLAAALSSAQGAAAAPDPQADAMQWSDLELARRIQHILMLADMEQEEKNKSAEEKMPLRSDGRADIQEKAQKQNQEQNQAVAPPPVTHLAPDELAPGFVRFPSHAPEPVLPDEVLPHDVLPDEERPRFDPFDPHPGYRWIR